MSSSRMRLVVALALVGAAGACTCSGPPAPPPELILSFAKPLDRQVLTALDDADPTADGFQLDVELLATLTNGEQPELTSAVLDSRVSSGSTWTPAPPAQLTQNRAHFENVSLPVRTNILRA